MQLWWGNYAFPVNGAEVTNQARAVISPQGVPLRYDVDYNVNVKLYGTGQADLTKRENLLRAALAVPYQDFVLKTDTGAASSSKIINKETLSGTRVTNIRFGEAQGGEYVNQRTCEFTVSATFLIANAANACIEWRETVTIQGNGGPLIRWRYPVNGPGIPQIVSPYSPVIATQQGRAVGHTKRPRPPAKLWPKFLQNETDTYSSDSPELLGLGYVNYPVTWLFRYESGVGPLVGFAGLPLGVI